MRVSASNARSVKSRRLPLCFSIALVLRLADFVTCGEGETYGPSLQVKTWSKPQDRTCASCCLPMARGSLYCLRRPVQEEVEDETVKSYWKCAV